MIERRLEELWRDLQGKKPHLPHFLSEIRLDGIRGFNTMRWRRGKGWNRSFFGRKNASQPIRQVY